MAKKSAKSVIKCSATRRHLPNGAETENLQGIRVTIAHSQKRTLSNGNRVELGGLGTAYRRIAVLVAEGKLEENTLARGVYARQD